MIKRNNVERGDIAVFKNPSRPEQFYIKRIVAIPGDRIKVENGRILINGEANQQDAADLSMPIDILDIDNFDHFIESNGRNQYSVLYAKDWPSLREKEEVVVPEDSFFAMGDNRDQSSDSRAWGFVPYSHLMGRAWAIWLSCTEDVGINLFACEADPMRRERFFKSLR